MGENGGGGSKGPDGLEGAIRAAIPENRKAPRGESVLAALEVGGDAAPRRVLRDIDSDPTPVLSSVPPEESSPSARYQLVGEIARGGMGVILKGRDTDLCRDVAMKVLKASYADRPELVRRFVEEAQIGGQLQHPGIVPVYDVGLHADGRPWFTMKLVKGRTLSALLEERESPAKDRQRFLSIFEHACQTIAYAHARGVLHRDLKPSNVMVGAFGEVQIVDWGLAKVMGHGGVVDEARAARRHAEVTIVTTVRTKAVGSDSHVGSVMGTPAYMSPEQARGKVEELDETADVFALGAILCEILTGLPPYAGDSDNLLVMAAEHRIGDARARLEACAADPGLAALALRCMALEKKDRFRDAAAVARAVQAHVASVEERARRAQADAAESRVRTAEAVARAAEERRARRTTLAASAAVVAALLLGGTAFAWARQERSQRLEQAAAPVLKTIEEATLQRGRALAAPVGELTPWAEVIAAAERAVRLAESGGADAFVLERARAFLAAVRGDEARAREAAARAAKERVALQRVADARFRRGEDFAAAATEAAFAAAFKDLDIEPGTTATEAAVALLRANPSFEELIAALDEWGFTNKSAAALAAAADPDPARRRLRDLAAKGDTAAMEALLKDEAFLKEGPWTLLLLGDLLGRARSFESAVAAVRKAQLKDPLGFWPTAGLGWCLSQGSKGEWPEASRSLMAATVARPEDIGAHYHLGIAQGKAGDPEGAVMSLRHVFRMDPEYGMVRKLLAEALKVNAGVLSAGGGYEKAVENLRESLTVVPGAAEVHVFLGTVLLYMDNLDGAEAELKEGGRLDTKHAGLHYAGLTTVMLRRGDLDGAIALCEEATVEFPFGGWHLTLGNLMVCRRDYAAALPSLREAARLAPTGWTLTYLAYGQGLAGDFEGALESWRKFALQQPGYSVAAFETAKTLRALGRFDEAATTCRDMIDELRERVNKAPGRPVPLLSLAAALVKVPDPALRDIPGALEAARKAVELVSEDFLPSYLPTLGIAQYQAGDFPGAAETLQRVDALYRKQNPRIETSASCYLLFEPWLYQAMALWQAGRREEALDLFEKTTTWIKRTYGRSDPPGINFYLDDITDEAATLLGRKK